MINNKTLTELRTIAQGLGVGEIFTKTSNQLIQDIELKHKELIPPPIIIIPTPAHDVRLMTGEPAAICDKDSLMELLQPFIDRGLKVVIGEETWRFSFGNRVDTGTLRMPLRVALKKAQEVLL